MTLDEAIRHLIETLTNPAHEWNCPECKAEHEQLLAWLKELKAVKDIVDHWNDENSSFVSATIAFEKILDVFKESEDK